MELITALICGLLYPCYIIVGKLTERKSQSKIKNYQISSLLLAVNGGLCCFCILCYEHYQGVFKFSTGYWSLGFLFAIISFGIYQLNQTKINQSNFIKYGNKLRPLTSLLPKTSLEFRYFSLLSFCAALFEEIIFRVFLVTYLAHWVQLPISIFSANLIFGLSHISSGKLNMLNAFIAGLLFSGIYFLTDNIWLVVCLHLILDISTGLVAKNYHSFQMKQWENSSLEAFQEDLTQNSKPED